MDFQNAIISALGLQQVEITDIKMFKKDLRAVIHCRQQRDEKSRCQMGAVDTARCLARRQKESKSLNWLKIRSGIALAEPILTEFGDI